MKKINIYLLLFAVLFSGCGKITEKQYTQESYKSEIVCVYVYYNHNKPQEIIVDKKYKRSECPECKGTGILVSGDGLSRIACQYCEPDKQSVGLFSTQIKCCEDCICDGECYCSYPGECLIKKNHGWAVMRCDEQTCRTYYPKDKDGKSYDPYKYGIESGEIPPNKINEYKDYKEPIKIDEEGNPIPKIKMMQIQCRTCR